MAKVYKKTVKKKTVKKAIAKKTAKIYANKTSDLVFANILKRHTESVTDYTETIKKSIEDQTENLKKIVSSMYVFESRFNTLGGMLEKVIKNQQKGNGADTTVDVDKDMPEQMNLFDKTTPPGNIEYVNKPAKVETGPPLTLDDVRDALKNVGAKHNLDKVREVLGKFKAQRVTDISVETYPEFMKVCTELVSTPVVN